MENNLKIDEVLAKDIENLNNLAPGSVEKEKEVRNIDTLYRLNLEQSKLELNKLEEGNRNAREAAKLEQERKSEKIKAVIEVFKVAVPLTAYGIFYNQGLRFEETGAYTSATVRGLLTKMKFPIR